MILHRHFRQAWKIDEGKVEYVRRVNGKGYGLVRDILPIASDLVCSSLDLLPDLREVVELGASFVKELAKLGVRVWNVRCTHAHYWLGCVDPTQAKHEWASCDDSAATRQEITTHNRLDDTGLAT